jgi:Domain of unknown function (DUF4956)
MGALWLNLAIDVAAITVVAYGIYFRRYYRRDLLLAYFSLNLGVFAVTALLTNSKASVGLGLGLFGILSIIRLRSDSITQEEIAYYFVALALGLISGLPSKPVWLAPALTASLVAVMYVVDHPRLTARSQRQTITLDRAYPDRAKLQAALERLLGGEVRHIVVAQLDLVADTTIVDVRYRLPRSVQPPLEAVVPARPKGATA